MKSIIKLISLFTKKERRRLYIITIALLFTAFLEVVEVSSLSPFIAVATNPDIVNRQRLLSFFYKAGNFSQMYNGMTKFLIFLGISIFVLIIFIMLFRTIVSYISQRYVANRRYTLSVRLFKQYMFQPYQFFLDKNSVLLSRNLLTEVNMAIDSVLWPAIDIFTNGMEALAILVLLFIINPLVALFSLGVFGLLYFGMYAYVRSKLLFYGKTTRTASKKRYKITAETFGGIKEIKILGKEPFFASAFNEGARVFATSQAAKKILTTLPGRIMHSLATGFAIALTVVILITGGSLASSLPLLSIYAFAILRLRPNFQNLFKNVALIRYFTPIVDALYKDLTTLKLPSENLFKEASAASTQVLPFTKNIELKEIQFSYPSSRGPVLKGIYLTIEKNTSVAFAGTTGCGKTTLVDVIMGLLEPSAGAINIDGVAVMAPSEGKDNRAIIANWQRNFGYVPQQIYLSDNTVAANIAFGVPEDMRDAAAVESAAKTANLHNFIVEELPNGYKTTVGERGIRFSGGQRQRIGIARALYHDPSILVMDEATSALDSITEDAIMDAIQNLKYKKTVIIIAHRLSTIKECNVIYLMEQGNIIASGKYDELLKNSTKFRALAKAGEEK